MTTVLSPSTVHEIDALLEKYPGSIGKDAHPGTVVGVINKQGDLIYLKATGPNTANESKPLEEDAVRPT